MATAVKGAVAYKKKDGTLSISKDQRSVVWLPLGALDTANALSITVANITNLQQTPEHAKKVMLRVFEKSPDAPEPVIHQFHFNSPENPRDEANAIKDSLTTLISAAKANDANIPRSSGAGGASAAMAMASAVKSRPDSGASPWYDDARLKGNFVLQQSLMKKDPLLLQTYTEARRTKPDSVSDSHFNAQFWSTRTNLLRAHAVEINQKRGAYNVLSAVKPRTVDGELKLNISAEQIQLIFSQHPLVKRVYDENVPKLNETDFWSRFFLSRLSKKLKGERVTEADSTDPTFDRYLDAKTDDGLSQRLLSTHVPHMIDLEGNEENQGGAKSGNRKDWTMRPGSTTKVPIIRTLNNLSEKLMEQVAPSDKDPSDPIGMDEETFNALALRDLQGDAEENRIMLNIKEQSRFFSSDKSAVSDEAAVYAKQIPSEVLLELQMDVDPAAMGNDEAGGLDLQTAIGVRDDSDSEDEGEKILHVGSRASIKDAQKHILEGVKARRTQIEGSSTEQSLSGLSQIVFGRLKLTHATTTEFLHQFWLVFLSGNPDRAGELSQNAKTLENAMDRINAVAADAEKERDHILEKKRQHIRDVYESSGRKLQWNPKSVAGGAKVVKEMMAPTIQALDKAKKEYNKALAAEGIDVA